MQTLEQALPYKDKLIAVGLDSAEMGHPPSKFIHVFHEAEKAGLLTCAHAGEEGPPAYMWEAIRLLHVSRIEHGVQCIHDEDLMAYLKDTQLPLTVCPISNVKLRVFDQMKNHNIKILLDKGLCVCVNSDDPSYFGGYVTDNFLAVHRALNLTEKEVIQLAKNSIQSSFISEAQKKIYLNKIDLCKEG